MKKFASKTASFVQNNKLLIAGALAGIGAGLAKTIKMYGIQEQAITTLNQSLKNQGALTQETSRDLQEFASGIQRMTTFGDEAVIGLQSQLINFGLLGDELKTATQATLDMSVATGTDLKAAALLVGKAFKGETGSLSRYGIILDKGIPKTEKFTNALSKMNQMFGGQAEAQKATTLGQITSMSNAFGDLQETLGSLVAGEGKSLIKTLTTWIEKIDDSLKLIRETTREFGNFGKVISAVALESLRSITQALLGFIDRLIALKPIMQLIGIDMDVIKKKIDDQIDSWQSTARAAEDGASTVQKSEVKKQIAIKETTKALTDAEKKRNEEIERIAQIRIDRFIKDKQDQIEAQNKFADDMMLSVAAWTNFAQEQASQMFNQFGQGVADMIL
jgi:hypothetical protein